MAEHTVMMKETLLALLNSKKYLSLRDILATMNPVDIAAIFDELEEDRLPLLFRLLPKELASETFVEMDPEAPLTYRSPSQEARDASTSTTLRHTRNHCLKPKPRMSWSTCRPSSRGFIMRHPPS